MLPSQNHLHLWTIIWSDIPWGSLPATLLQWHQVPWIPDYQHEQGLLQESEATVSSPRVETTQEPSGFILLAVLIFPSQSFLFLSYCALCLFLQSSLILSGNEIKYKNKTVIPCHGWVA